MSACLAAISGDAHIHVCKVTKTGHCLNPVMVESHLCE